MTRTKQVFLDFPPTADSLCVWKQQAPAALLSHTLSGCWHASCAGPHRHHDGRLAAETAGAHERCHFRFLRTSRARASPPSWSPSICSANEEQIRADCGECTGMQQQQVDCNQLGDVQLNSRPPPSLAAPPGGRRRSAECSSPAMHASFLQTCGGGGFCLLLTRGAAHQQCAAGRRSRDLGEGPGAAGRLRAAAPPGELQGPRSHPPRDLCHGRPEPLLRHAPCVPVPRASSRRSRCC